MAPDLKDTEVLIVGSGPLGCTFARALAQAGRTVTMVDAGPQLSQRPGQHLKNAFVYQRDIDSFAPIVRAALRPLSVPVLEEEASAIDPIAFRPTERGIRNAQNPNQDPQLNLSAAAASYAVGGMFVHWTNNTPRHHPTIERTPIIPPDEWDELYHAAEALLDTRRDVFDKSIRHVVVREALAAHYGDRLADGYGVQAMAVAGRRRKDNDEFVAYTGADTILGPLLDGPARERFELLAEHRVKSLVVDGSRVVEAHGHDLMTGREFQMRADLFIVAGGSILTPQLLFASGIDSDRLPALGGWLTEHPLAFTQVVLRDSIVEAITSDDRFAAARAKVEEEDAVPIPMHDPPPSLMIPVSDNRRWHCQIQRDSFSYGELPPDIDTRLVVDLRWFSMTEPNEDNRVCFDIDLHDTFGMPKPTFEFRLSNRDRELAHAMMGDMLDAAMALGAFLPGAEPRFMPPGLAQHFMGTTRMGEHDDGTAVVDPYSRVFGFENLYLGGNSLIPTATASNPTLTSIALAIRAANQIVGRARPHRPL